MCLGYQAGTQLQPRSFKSSDQGLPRYLKTESFSGVGAGVGLGGEVQETGGVEVGILIAEDVRYIAG